MIKSFLGNNIKRLNLIKKYFLCINLVALVWALVCLQMTEKEEPCEAKIMKIVKNSSVPLNLWLNFAICTHLNMLNWRFVAPVIPSFIHELNNFRYRYFKEMCVKRYTVYFPYTTVHVISYFQVIGHFRHYKWLSSCPKLAGGGLESH